MDIITDNAHLMAEKAKTMVVTRMMCIPTVSPWEKTNLIYLSESTGIYTLLEARIRIPQLDKVSLVIYVIEGIRSCSNSLGEWEWLVGNSSSIYHEDSRM